ncbi:MAG: uracil phosphoribosyltransferase [Sulfurospirillaceae bacterium]|nr:uracil phosphoribosyltransferase [Sulfurospirillaceae bacterium]
MMNVHVISHPLIEHKLSILRDKRTEPFQFRLLVDEISYLMLFEATRDLPLKSVKVKTPVAVAEAKKLDAKIMICPILRAALGMLDGIFKLIPDASVGFLGFQRNEKTLEAEFYYAKLPKDCKERVAIIIDPMFATGGTAIDAVNFLKSKGIKDIRFLCLVSAPEGLKRFSETHPDVPVYTACIDDKLNNDGYIVPGLGDAGDRVFNTIVN